MKKLLNWLKSKFSKHYLNYGEMAEHIVCLRNNIPCRVRDYNGLVRLTRKEMGLREFGLFRHNCKRVEAFLRSANIPLTAKVEDVIIMLELME